LATSGDRNMAIDSPPETETNSAAMLAAVTLGRR